MPPHAAQTLLAVNLAAPIELTRALLPSFGDRPGYLIYVSSIAARMGVAGRYGSGWSYRVWSIPRTSNDVVSRTIENGRAPLRPDK